MKSVLLLAAVYALIINESQKRSTARAVPANGLAVPVVKIKPVHTQTSWQGVPVFAYLTEYKRSSSFAQ